MALLNFFRPANTIQMDYSLETLLDSLEDVVLSVASGDRLNYVNRCWENLTGVSKKNCIQRTLTSFFHPEDIQTWQQAVNDVAETRTSKLIWIRIIGSDEELRWCEMRLQSMSGNTLYPISATLCDITPQVREEQVRNASHRSLNGLVNNIPAMIYRSRNNLSWTMEYVSDGCVDVTGYKAEEMMNQPQLSYGSMIDPQDAGDVWREVQEALHEHRSYELKYHICDANGKRRMVLEKGRGVYSDSGHVLGVQGVIFSTHTF